MKVGTHKELGCSVLGKNWHTERAAAARGGHWRHGRTAGSQSHRLSLNTSGQAPPGGTERRMPREAQRASGVTGHPCRCVTKCRTPASSPAWAPHGRACVPVTTAVPASCGSTRRRMGARKAFAESRNQ